MPIIGFNSGKYDLNAIKLFLITYFLSTSKTEEKKKKKRKKRDGIGSFFFIKRNNTFMCLSINQLKILDMTNYFAPGFNYDKYLHTTSGQWSREENKQTSGGRVVQSNEHGVSVPRLLLPWSPVHPTRGERRQRETLDPTTR